MVAQINWSAPTDEAPVIIFCCRHRERDKPNFTGTMSTYNFICYFKGSFTACNSHTIIIPHSFIFNFCDIYLVCGEHTYMVCMYKGQRTTCRNRFSSTNTWVLEMKFKSLGTSVNYFTRQVISSGTIYPFNLNDFQYTYRYQQPTLQSFSRTCSSL